MRTTAPLREGARKPLGLAPPGGSGVRPASCRRPGAKTARPARLSKETHRLPAARREACREPCARASPAHPDRRRLTRRPRLGFGGASRRALRTQPSQAAPRRGGAVAAGPRGGRRVAGRPPTGATARTPHTPATVRGATGWRVRETPMRAPGHSPSAVASLTPVRSVPLRFRTPVPGPALRGLTSGTLLGTRKRSSPTPPPGPA